MQIVPLQVNHISPQSEQFQDFIAKGDASEYAEMFVDWDKLWPEGAWSSCLRALLCSSIDGRMCVCVLSLLLATTEWQHSNSACSSHAACADSWVAVMLEA